MRFVYFVHLCAIVHVGLGNTACDWELLHKRWANALEPPFAAATMKRISASPTVHFRFSTCPSTTQETSLRCRVADNRLPIFTNLAIFLRLQSRSNNANNWQSDYRQPCSVVHAPFTLHFNYKYTECSIIKCSDSASKHHLAGCDQRQTK